MFSSPEPFLLAELDYRREQISADFAAARNRRRHHAARPTWFGRRAAHQTRGRIAAQHH